MQLSVRLNAVVRKQALCRSAQRRKWGA